VTPQQQQQQQQQQQVAAFAKSLQHLQPGSILAPSSTAELLQAMAVAAAAGLPVHILGGNTGAGLFKKQWGALSSSVCVLVKGVQELQQVSVQPASSSSSSTGGGSTGLLAGSGVTITQLLGVLQEMVDVLQGSHVQAGQHAPPAPSAVSAAGAKLLGAQSTTTAAGAAAAAAAAVQQDVTNLQYMVTHMRRIAGTLVRNAATLGGHLALARRSHFESDLVTLMVATGGEVCVTCLDGSCEWVDLGALCQAGQQQQQQGLLQQLDKQQQQQ
jgi:xanthine dehydrogenase iron-sulfur cluster and FAD-binding subunit A